MLKIDIGTCPMFHWIEPRVRAHVAICYTAFALLRHLIHHLRVPGSWHESFSEARVLTELRNVQASLIRYAYNGDHYLLPQCPPEPQKAIYQIFGTLLPVRCYRLEEDGEPRTSARSRRKLRQ